MSAPARPGPSRYSARFAEVLCDMGIDPSKARSVEVTIPASGSVTMKLELYVGPEVLDALQDTKDEGK